jgi:hypothetical protein
MTIKAVIAFADVGLFSEQGELGAHDLARKG